MSLIQLLRIDDMELIFFIQDFNDKQKHQDQEFPVLADRSVIVVRDYYRAKLKKSE